LFDENFLRLTPMDAPDRARRGKPPRRLCCGAIPADVAFLNREAGAFLDGVTEGGKNLD
jgi:hypothetical protein